MSLFKTVTGGAAEGLRRTLLAMLDRQARRGFRQRGHRYLFDRRRPDARPPGWSDLWFLYMATTVLKPAMVLEFGSGCSTLAIGQALAENANAGSPGRLVALEAEPDWAAATLAMLPAYMAPLVELRTVAVRAQALLYMRTKSAPAYRSSESLDATHRRVAHPR